MIKIANSLIRYLLIYSAILCIPGCTQDEIREGIWSEITSPISGVKNTYIYVPPKGVSLPEIVYAYVFYNYKQDQVQYTKVPVDGESGQYEFSVAVPDSTAVIVVGLFDKTSLLLDNNKGKGYILPLYRKNGSRFDRTEIEIAETLSPTVRHKLQLRLQRETFINLYEKNYAFKPSLKEDGSYLNYLRLLYFEKRDSVKPLLLEYAKASEAEDSESEWLASMTVYSLLMKSEDVIRVEGKILELYPNGILATENFMEDFHASADLSDEEILAWMETYLDRYAANQVYSTDEFFLRLLKKSLSEYNADKLDKYESGLNDKRVASDPYNETAMEVLDNPNASENDLDFVEAILKRALFISSEDTTTTPRIEDYTSTLEKYAHILFKTSRVDSACYYMERLRKGHHLDVNGIEKYAVYMQKAQGAPMAKQFIEQQLVEGIYSMALLYQLDGIYSELNMSEEEFKVMKQNYMTIIKKKKKQEVLATFESERAPEFTLKNLDGEFVSLSSLKGKIIVLDFWATWCRPCIAMFPDMKQLMAENMSKGDIEFLYIDVREGKDEDTMRDNAKRLMDKNEYPFNVLLDSGDQAAKDYKIDFLPAKFIIDREGNIAFTGLRQPIEYLAFEIEAVRMH